MLAMVPPLIPPRLSPAKYFTSVQRDPCAARA
jgi:hypothetical protein